MICAAQEKALRKDSIKYAIDTTDLPLCRWCREATYNVSDIDSFCTQSEEKECRRYRDKVALRIQSDLDCAEKWYEHSPFSLVENGQVKLMWDTNILTGKCLESKRPTTILVHKSSH